LGGGWSVPPLADGGPAASLGAMVTTSALITGFVILEVLKWAAKKKCACGCGRGLPPAPTANHIDHFEVEKV